MCGEVPLEIRLDWSRMSSVTRICSVEGCENRSHSRGLCGSHYQSARRQGGTLPNKTGRISQPPRECTIPGCENKHLARGYCGTHYSRQRRGIPLEAPISDSRVNQGVTCHYPGCDSPAYCRKLCSLHYHRERNGRDMDAPRPVKWSEVCTHPNRFEESQSRGLCKLHYGRQRRGRDMDKAFPTRIVSPDGRCLIQTCDRDVKWRGLCNSHYQQAKKYSLGWESLNRLIAPGACMSCGVATTILVIDHDHSCCPGEGSCGKCVRGALCRECNQGLGNFRDDIDRLESAIAYLSR
jgi:hypothetical protein